MFYSSIVGAVVSSISAAAPMTVAGPVLGALGFGSAGVTAGSLAAAVQVPNVAAGSVFAILQSAGAGGAAAAMVVAPFVQVVAVGGIIVIGARAALNR